jgi:crotonobetainyl-CoA:carnitine CoA-transferase CaiB-like acyl-CoA transferase
MPRRYGSGVSNIVPYQTFDAADGTLLIAAGNDLLFARLCAVLGQPELATDPRFATNGGRVTNREALIALLQAATVSWRAAELARALEDAGIPCGTVADVSQALEDPQIEALGIVGTLPGAGARTIGLPLSFDGQRPPLSGRAPRLGEHQDILDHFRKDAP